MQRPDPNELIPGRATPAGTDRFKARFAALAPSFRRPDRLALSSLSLGMRRGDPGGADDLLYRSAVAECLARGINVFNTALSDRLQTSERALGRALRRAFTLGEAARDEVVVVTKGGALTPDPAQARSYAHAQRDLYRSYVDTGLVDPARVVNGFSLDAPFLADQIARSQRNLGLTTIDLYLIEEPEHFLRGFGADAFKHQLLQAFRMLEAAVAAGMIGAYGVCTWDGLLVPHQERGHLSLVELFEIALEAGGGDHHFRALQLPFGIAAGEGAALASQLGPDGASRAVLELLAGTGTAVFASAPLYGGRVLGHLPEWVRRAFPELRRDSDRCLQFARSTRHVTSAVVGMRSPDHVAHNCELLTIAPADPSVPEALFRRAAASASHA
jgi:aryl-alcohol dehydrogenase-like predicted oxidoreductase